MILENIPIDEINEAHLKSLQDAAVEEGRVIEYKQFFGNTSDNSPIFEYSSLRDEAKKEFLADISSFANAHGGHLLIGIKEENRIAVEVDGILLSNTERTIQAAEQAIHAGIEPELRGLEIRAIPLENSNHVLLFRIKESFSKPHWVKYGGGNKFWSRNNTGKYSLGYHELRDSFIASTVVSEKIEAFRSLRVLKIMSGDIPFSLKALPTIALHLIPLSRFSRSPVNYDLSIFNAPNDRSLIYPFIDNITGLRFNADGFVSYLRGQANVTQYCQVFRNGIIESVATLERNRENPFIYWRDIAVVMQALPRYLQALKKISVDLPIVAVLSLMDVEGYAFGDDPRYSNDYIWKTFDRNPIVSSDVLIESHDAPLLSILRPLWDSVWQSAGYSHCHYYDLNGAWHEMP